jgi:hypothetical protein
MPHALSFIVTHASRAIRNNAGLAVLQRPVPRLLSAGKKILDVHHEKFRALTSLRSRIVSYWRGLTLPYVENGVRLIR